MEECDKTVTARERLEEEKLHAEIRNLTKRWWIPPTIQAIPAVLLVLVTASIAYFSGILDARRENLAAMNERLANQTLILKLEEKSQRDSLQLVTDELNKTKHELYSFKKEASAISELRRMYPNSQIGYFGEGDGFRVELSETDFNIFGVTEPIASKYINEALDKLSEIRNLTALAIRNIELSTIDINKIGRLTSLVAIDLENNGLDDEEMNVFPVLTSLKRMRFSRQHFTYPSSLDGYRNLEEVSLVETPICDKGLRFLRYSNPTLKSLLLSKTDVTDDCVSTLILCNNLTYLNIESTKATSIALDNLLLSNPKVHITINKSQISSDYCKELEEKQFKHRVFLSD